MAGPLTSVRSTQSASLNVRMLVLMAEQLEDAWERYRNQQAEEFGVDVTDRSGWGFAREDFAAGWEAAIVSIRGNVRPEGE